MPRAGTLPWSLVALLFAAALCIRNSGGARRRTERFHARLTTRAPVTLDQDQAEVKTGLVTQATSGANDGEAITFLAMSGPVRAQLRLRSNFAQRLYASKDTLVLHRATRVSKSNGFQVQTLLHLLRTVSGTERQLIDVSGACP